MQFIYGYIIGKFKGDMLKYFFHNKPKPYIKILGLNVSMNLVIVLYVRYNHSNKRQTGPEQNRQKPTAFCITYD